VVFLSKFKYRSALPIYRLFEMDVEKSEFLVEDLPFGHPFNRKGVFCSANSVPFEAVLFRSEIVRVQYGLGRWCIAPHPSWSHEPVGAVKEGSP
jgi:hypothetical protein